MRESEESQSGVYSECATAAAQLAKEMRLNVQWNVNASGGHDH